VRSSVKQDAAYDELIDRTRQVWCPRLERDLSREDARQIAESVTGFFTVLAEWSRAEMSAEAIAEGAGAELIVAPPDWAGALQRRGRA
jgi:hypothetical protein